ncbi:aminotransferase class I/II-fold pyridoxal phosphate-dependent enzyme [Ruegeria sp. HKCCD6604]|uniref:aminotransferase class I/II-fold pyridoxal phosphate-dependent enzyme n=1 Tax=Ruegeria sp. HKCCD6604 TaxID=2683000 RepID=UPI001490A14B|nr:aminotransferase class I/II-fold pyridoxal phosphate-dependent enzyme [Ruegeria sp. HKCCD6604]NOC92354.1 aminotransferase class I/II-fold pyridoxal phosphate-dependent enzyme [Ruegeria sp. HKCCD6604]
METDRFGNMIDASVGYARGRYLSSSATEIRRLRHAQAVAAEVLETRGADGIGIFTGNPRYFPLKPDDLSTYCEEWVGPGLFSAELTQAAIAHFGGGDTVAVTNRTSAGIVAAILALCDGRPVVSVVPDKDRSHASVVRGCRLAGVELVEIEGSADPGPAITTHAPALVVITTVTSTLARLPDAETSRAIAEGRAAGATVFLDEAYGARLRPVLHGGALSLSMGADIAITNADKAGLCGPRAGILCGASAPVLATLAKASELGQEARAPLAAGAMRSLQAFDPEDLRIEASDGASIAEAMAGAWGAEVVLRSDLGPMLDEEDVLARVLSLAGRDKTDIVPAEATAAIGMLLLKEHGVLTVNTHGAPGGRVSLRLKPTAGAVAAVGGVAALVSALDSATEEVSHRLDDDAWFKAVLFGDES